MLYLFAHIARADVTFFVLLGCPKECFLITPKYWQVQFSAFELCCIVFLEEDDLFGPDLFRMRFIDRLAPPFPIDANLCVGFAK